jgi:hypothetical protein
MNTTTGSDAGAMRLMPNLEPMLMIPESDCECNSLILSVMRENSSELMEPDETGLVMALRSQIRESIASVIQSKYSAGLRAIVLLAIV